MNDYLCDPSDGTTFESLREAVACDGRFPDDVYVWEPFQDMSDEIVLDSMECLANSIQNGIKNALQEALPR